MESESRRTSIAKYLDALTGLIGIIVFANVIGASGLGLYYILSALNRIGNRPATGISTANEHFISSQEQDRDSFISTAVMLGFFASLIVSIIAYGSYTYIPLLDQFEVPRSAFYALIILIVSSSLFQLGRGSYSGVGRPASAEFVNASRGVIETTIQVFAVISGYGVAGMLIGTAVSAVIGFLYMMLKPSVEIGTPSVSKAKELLSYARWSMVTRIIDALYKRMDTLILGFLVSPAATGVYSATRRVVQPVRIIGFGVKRPMIISVSQYDSVTDELHEKLNSLGGYAGILGIPLIFGAIVVGEGLLEILYSPEFVEGYLILIGSAVYYTFVSHNSVLSEFVHGMSEPKIVTYSLIVATLLRSTVAVFLVYQFGLNGVVPAMVLSAVVRFGLLYVMIKSSTGQYYSPHRVKYQSLASFIMFIVIVPLQLTPAQDIFLIPVSIAIGGIVYIVSLFYLDKPMKDEFLRLLNQKVLKN